MKTSKPLRIDFRAARRVVLVMTAALLAVSGLPVFWHGNAAGLAAQLQSRYIQLSDSAPSPGGGCGALTGVGTGCVVSIQVNFTAVTQASSMVIDFCQEDPLIGDTCTAPTGLSVTGVTLNAAAFSGTVQTGTDNWSAASSSGSTIKLADDNTGGGSGGTHPTHDIQAGAVENFKISGLTNPSGVGTFYARITTYHDTGECDTNGGAPGTHCYNGPTTGSGIGPGNYEDYGGIALSTANVIQITARVQESLTFCVTAAAPDTSLGGTGWTGTTGNGGSQGTCASSVPGSNPPSITLGQGSPTKILDTTRVDTAPVFDQLTTNATHGAIINMLNANTTCTYTGSGSFPGGGLSADGGTTCAIPPVNDGGNAAATANDIVAGTAAFGVDVCAFTPASQPANNPVGALDPTAIYNANVGGLGGVCTNPTNGYGMDTQTQTGGTAPYPYSRGNTVTTYGSTIAISDITPATPGPAVGGPVSAADDQLTFAATPSLTTPAGIYTANIVLVATGTF